MPFVQGNQAVYSNLPQDPRGGCQVDVHVEALGALCLAAFVFPFQNGGRRRFHIVLQHFGLRETTHYISDLIRIVWLN